MTQLQAVDSAEVQILVDNVTDGLSSVPEFVETEFAGLRRRRQGQWVLGGGCLCCAAHGLFCLITVRQGGLAKTVLFDTGPEDRTFEQNASRLGVDLGAVEVIVLSHGHWDHGSGMSARCRSSATAMAARTFLITPIPTCFVQRALKRPDGTFQVMEDVPGVAALTAHGARVINTTEPQTFFDGMAYVSGEIPRVTIFERGASGTASQDRRWQGLGGTHHG
jgi:7,8-dihydropterin-6-yl-methyl-4-(beta-D-ribofuranosyl)aminobenzene 5'-phosphate synthase